MKKINRTHAGWAVKTWVIATVFLLPFLEMWQVVLWLVLGAALGIVWKQSPEGPPEAPVEPLPYAHQYKHKEVPRRET